MIRRLIALVALLSLSLTSPSCSAIGDPGGLSGPLPHGGTGQFRPLSEDELGGIIGVAGRAIFTRDVLFENGMVVGAHVFYTTAPALDVLPMIPEDHPANEIYFPAFEPRRIHRGDAREEGTGAFNSGAEVLAASEAWEGTDVFDPWVVEAEDGSARLYYAAEGGIGVAAAPSLDGTFTRVGTTPVLGPADAAIGSPRRPSVVPSPQSGFLMYYDAGSELRVAVSDDGLAWTAMGPLSWRGDDSIEDPAETRAMNPGAVTVRTPANRMLVRLYFESLRADGTHRIYVAGSEDGLSFERHPFPALASENVRFPAPLPLDERVTLLYSTTPFRGGALQTHAFVVAVSPAGESFLPPEDPAEE